MSKENKWTSVITSKRKRFHLGFKEIIEYRDLLFLFFKRDFTALYKQTILGPAWYLIQPLFTTVVYSFVFGNLAGLSTEGTPKHLFYLSGIILWRFFSDTVRKTSNTFLQNAGLFGKVYFPRLAAPISSIMSNFVALGIQIFLFLIFYVYYYFNGMLISVHWTILLVPLLFIQTSMLGAGLGLLISSLTTKYRDLKFLVTFGLQLWMYGSPIAYSLTEILEKSNSRLIDWLFMYNPIAFPVEVFRYMLFHNNSLLWKQGIVSITFTILIFIIGIFRFNKEQQDFMDRI